MLWVLAKDQRLRPLTDSENQAIRDWWGGSAGAANPAAARIIRLAREEGSWLACSCRGAVLSEMPILAPVLTGTTYSLRRLATRALHTEECCYFAEAKQIEDQDDVFDNLTPEQVPSFDLPLTNANRSEAKGKVNHRTKTSTASMMARRLWFLADRAGWQRMPRDPNKSDIGAVLAVAKTITSSEKPISFFATTRAWTEGWIASALGPGRGTPVDVVWWVIKLASLDIERRVIEVVNSTLGRSLLIEIRGDIEVWAKNPSPENFPMAALAAVRMDEHGILYVDSLYAQPIAANDNWMLLESSAQRQTLKELLTACDWIRKKNVAVTLEKPLYAWHGHAKPDFLLGTPNRFLAVETVCDDDAAPRARRATLFQKAEVLWHFPAVTPSGTPGEIGRWALRRPG